MIITEQEAKKRWCPFARIIVSGVSANRNHPGVADDCCLCIASTCMTWRAIETSEFNDRANAEFRTSGKRLKCDTGYCGLAGEP